MIRVAFRYGDKRIFARAVCWLRGGDSAHCEVSHRWEGEEALCTSASFMDGGVRQKTINLSPDKWRVYEMDISPEDVVKWHRKHQGKKYDVLGLLGFIWRRVEGSARRFFCSEVSAEIMGLPEPQLYDLRTLESVCIRFGKRVY